MQVELKQWEKDQFIEYDGGMGEAEAMENIVSLEEGVFCPTRLCWLWMAY